MSIWLKKVVVYLSSIFEESLKLKQPYPIYSVCLREQFIKWQASRIKRGLHYELEHEVEFIQAYFTGNEHEKYLLCELYVHDFLLSGNTKFHPGEYVGDV